MGETQADYGHGPGDSSAWDRREAFHDYQRRRMLAVQLGDVYLDIARAYAKLRPWHIPKATGLLVKAVAEYQAAGLTRQGQIAWRYAQRLHRASSPQGSPQR